MPNKDINSVLVFSCIEMFLTATYYDSDIISIFYLLHMLNLYCYGDQLKNSKSR